MIREVLLGTLLFIFIKPLLSSIAFATVLAVALFPIYSLWKKKLIAVLLVLLSVGSLFYLGYLVGGTLFGQVSSLVELYNQLSPEAKANIVQFSSNIPLTDFTINFAKSLPSVFIQFLFFVVFTYFFLVDGWQMKDLFYRYLPKRKAEGLVNEGWENLRSIVMGVFVSMFFYFLLSLGVLKFVSSPSALIYASLATLFSVLPLVGAWMVYVFPIYQFYLANNYFGIGAIVTFQLLWHILLDPFFKMKYRGTLHPAVLLGSMTAGIYYFGFPGVVIGPLFITALKTLAEVEKYTVEPLEVKEEY